MNNNKILLIMAVLITLTLFPFPAFATTLDSNLMFFYNLEETSGTSVIDSVGNYNGVSSSATLLEDGVINYGYSVTSSEGSKISVSSLAPSSIPDTISVSMWVYNTKGFGQLWGTLGSSISGATKVGYIAQLGGDGSVSFITQSYNGASNVTDSISTDPSVVDFNSWEHIVFTLNEITEVGKIYINGVEEATGTLNEQGSYNTFLKFGAGYDNHVPTNVSFAGKMDLIGVWDRDLNSDEVLQLYNSDLGVAYPFYNITSDFTYSVDKDLKEISLVDASYTDSIGSVANWSWTIDGNVISTSQNPVYTYVLGDYQTQDFNVCLYVENSSNSDLNNTSCQTITIEPLLSDVLTISDLVNVSNYSFNENEKLVNLNISSGDYFEFSVTSASNDFNVNYYWTNSRSSKQYYVYTSSDGIDWAFNSTLTFGNNANYSNPIQKILLNETNYYYKFGENLSSTAKRYYRLIYRDVAKYWNVINSSEDWIKLSVVDNYLDTTNNQNFDLYNDSNYSSVNVNTRDYFPDLNTSDFEAGGELQFTAYSSVTTEMLIGLKVNGVVVSSVTIELSSTPQRFSIPLDSNDFDSVVYIGTDNESSSRIYIVDYAIIPKAYFVDRLDIFKEDGSDLTAILVDSSSELYLQEGIPYKVKTKAFDLDGTLKKLRLEAILNGVVVNTIEQDLSEATKENKVFTWEEQFARIIDLNGFFGNPVLPRDVTIKATLIDVDNKEVSEQFRSVKFLQYPYFNDDIGLFISPLSNKVGVNPEFRFRLTQDLPENFIGFRISLYDSDSTLENPDYDEYIYNSELNCSFECFKDIKLDDFVFEKEDIYKLHIKVLLSTENESGNDNILTNFTIPISVSYKEYETARIFQTFERSSLTYRNDEPIELVLQLRDVPYIDLKDRTSVYLTLDICSNDSGACDTNGTTKFTPKYHFYDETTGYNYYYWNNIFYEDGGSLLEDGNYIRFRANISDSYYSHDVSVIPVATLGDKCSDGDFNDIGSFLYNYLASSVTGCNTPASPVIEIGDAEEKRILIDEAYERVGTPNQSILCVKPNNDYYRNTLKQDLFCAVIYKRSEISIDNFNILIGNDNSNYARTGSEKQFIDFTIPAEDVLFNDPYLMQQALDVEYGADSVNTIGEFIFYSIDNLFAGVLNPVVEIPTALTDAGIVKNINWDINFDGFLDPTFVTGIFFINIEGFDVVNQYDYISSYPELELLNPSNFRQFAVRNKIVLPKKETIVSVYASDLKQVERFKTASPLVIFEEPSISNVSSDNGDENISSGALPTILKFDYISDMVYDSGKSYNRVFIPLTLSQLIVKPFNINDLIGSYNNFTQDPWGWFEDNWFALFILLVLIVIGALVFGSLKSGQNINIINRFSRKGE